MRIVIPSYGRAETLTTPALLETAATQHWRPDYRVCVHTEAQKAAYVKGGRVPEERIVVTGAERGIIPQRQWINEKWADPGEWYVVMDDNVRGFTAVPEPWYREWRLPVTEPDDAAEWRERYRTECGVRRFLRIAEECRQMAEAVGAQQCGFATVDNYYFRGRKWQEVAYVISKVAVRRAGAVKMDDNLVGMGDWDITAEHLWRYGCVLVNNYVYPRAGHYEPGGIGTYDERVEAKIRDCAYLMGKWPGLFRYKEKAGCHPKAELALRVRTRKTVDEWRRELREQRQAAAGEVA